MNYRIILILFIIGFASCRQNNTLYKSVPSSVSNIHFNNEIKETEQLNVVNYEYLYNGGGVGIGDFNNDSLPDIIFTGNLVPNKLYLNRGNLQFEDVTKIAGLEVNQKWCKGVSVVDINNDGMLDIYIGVSVLNPAENRKNLLYICQRIDPVLKLPIYREMAAEYGLADTSHTQMASFFDYDNDGDLDVYLLVNELNEYFPNEFRPIKNDGSMPNTDKLLRNDWNETLQHPFFSDVSSSAGIKTEGYGLGVSTSDINGDGWKDIYVSNDYLSNNLLYINNKNGTFTNRCNSYFKHTSRNAMGNDVADFNNDGLPDIVELDMAPADQYRLKMMNNPINYATFQNSDKYGYMHQYMRNVFQANQGPRMLPNDSIGEPIFSEIAYFSGIAQTDWSWAPLATDVDNDGWKDLLITNGLPKDMTDMDFMAYRDEAKNKTSLQQVLKQLPSVKIPNYVFKNEGNFQFTDKTKEWGWQTPTFSAGMAYADLDLDGDLDIVINNTNMEASIYENTLRQRKDEVSNFLSIRLSGTERNRNAIGTIIEIVHDGKRQKAEYNPYRGYLSTQDNQIHFGLGSSTIADTLIIYWPNHQTQILTAVKANQRLLINAAKSSNKSSAINTTGIEQPIFTITTGYNGINTKVQEDDFIDFTVQRLLPHKLSQYGPSLAAGDINNDGLDDLIIGGGAPESTTAYVQDKDGQFRKNNFPSPSAKKTTDDAGICLFDADNDNDLDVFIASGGYENSPGSTAYNDHFFRNNGKGSFVYDSTALPDNYTSKSCVKAADYDSDGDIDLFVGGRVLPGSYPIAVNSFIYENNGYGKFKDVTKQIAPALLNIGMICDATWSDADNDGDADLLLAGEWMPLIILKNENKKLLPVEHNLLKYTGWFNSISAADLDADGDMDYILGNYGCNGFYQPSVEFPIHIYGKDFDKNGSFDAVVTNWLPSAISFSKTEFPSASRDELIREMSYMKGRFPDYSSYAKTNMQDLFAKEELKGALKLSANYTKTCWIENKGNFQFLLHELPSAAQWSPIFGIVTADANEDGHLDILLNGNDFGMAPYLGRNDALNGLVLLGNGSGGFTPLSIRQSGIYLPGDGKALIQLIRGKTLMLAAAQNKGTIESMELKNKSGQFIRPLADETSALLVFKDGSKRKTEFYSGTSFFSQSSKFVMITASVKELKFYKGAVVKRTITIQ